MSAPIRAPGVNFSRDLRAPSLALALTIAGFCIFSIAAIGLLFWKSGAYRGAIERTNTQITDIGAQLESLRAQHTNEPDAAAIRALRQRIASLNALDFGAAPSVARVLAVFEELTPPAVALQSFDYDRGRGTLDLVAVSESSEELTGFFDITNRSSFFKSVRLVDKKQAGTSENGAPMFQVRLSIHFLEGEPRS
jgi:Fimbrial assembly protein (PilN)